MIQIYTGNGKGKTTAALGLALRAAGAGLKVYIGQFVKRGNYSELKALKKLKNVRIEQFGRSCLVKKRPGKKDLEAACRGLKKIKAAISKQGCDVVILDEINVALKLKLIRIEDVVELIKEAPEDIELILTGRGAPREILQSADLVSEIKEIKHYFRKGIKARKGIEY